MATSARAQDVVALVAEDLGEAPPSERTAKNSFYLEAGGASLIYSFDYERRFGDVAGRIGFGGIPDVAGSSSSRGSTSTSVIFVPVTFSYLGVGSKVHMLELGGGLTILGFLGDRSGWGGGLLAYSEGSGLGFFGNLLVGYRWQLRRSDFMLRVGADGLIQTSKIPVLPWPYLAAGTTF